MTLSQEFTEPGFTSEKNGAIKRQLLKWCESAMLFLVMPSKRREGVSSLELSPPSFFKTKLRLESRACTCFRKMYSKGLACQIPLPEHQQEWGINSKPENRALIQETGGSKGCIFDSQADLSQFQKFPGYIDWSLWGYMVN